MSIQQNSIKSAIKEIFAWPLSVVCDAVRLQRIEATQPPVVARISLVIEPEQLTGYEVNQVRAAMLYALLVTARIDPPNANNGYHWLSGQQPETPQVVDLSEVCGGSGANGRG